MQDHSSVSPETFGAIMLDVGLALLRAGASSNRIHTVINRLVTAYQFRSHLNVAPKSISILLESSEGESVFHGSRSAPDYGVNFRVLSGIESMSWAISQKPRPLPEIKNELRQLTVAPHYPRLLVLAAVALAGASFCYTFGGDASEMSITFGATFLGLFVKQELLKRSVNTFICTFLSALVAALLTGAFYKLGLQGDLGHAYSTCVLFLVPGVPLINSFIDLIGGHTLYSLDRGITALTHVFAIAFALAAAISIYQFPT